MHVSRKSWCKNTSAALFSDARGGGVWLQFTGRDYDEPDDAVSLHPTHGALPFL